MIYTGTEIEAAEVWAYIENAQAVLRPYVETPLQIQQAILGPSFGAGGYGSKSEMGARRDDPDNHHYEMMTRLISEMAYSAPRWTVTSRTGAGRRDYLMGIQSGLNRWSAQQELHKLAQRQAVDYQTGWACSVMTVGSNDVMQRRSQRARAIPRSLYREGGAIADMSAIGEAHATWPKHVRKSMQDLVWDMEADSWDERKWTAHRVRMDRRELLEIARKNPSQGWDLEAIMDLEINTSNRMNIGEKVENELGSPIIDQYRQTVEFWEVHMLDYRLPDADDYENELGRETNGTLITIAGGKPNGVRLRKDRPYAGPRQGLHRVSGAYWIGDERVPLSHSVAVERQVRDLNDIARAIRTGAQKYRRVVLYDPNIGNLKSRLKNSGDEMLVPYPGLMAEGKPAVVSLEMGGITPQMLTWFGIARDRLDRVSGHMDTDSGQSQANVTATVGSLAAMGSSARRAGSVQGWHDHQGWIGRSGAFYLINDEGVAFTMDGREAENIARELGLDQPGTLPAETALDMGLFGEAASRPAWIPGEAMIFKGGQADIDLDELAVDFDVSSGQHKSQQQRYVETNNAIGGLINMLPVIAQTPEGVDWKAVLDLLGSVQEIPGFSDLIDVQVLSDSDLRSMPEVNLATTAGADSGGAPSVLNVAGLASGSGGGGQRQTAAAPALGGAE